MSSKANLFPGVCVATLSATERTGFYLLLVTFVIVNASAITVYWRQFQQARQQPIVSISMEQLDIFPRFKLIFIAPSRDYAGPSLETVPFSVFDGRTVLQVHAQVKLQDFSDFWVGEFEVPFQIKQSCMEGDDGQLCGVGTDILPGVNCTKETKEKKHNFFSGKKVEYVTQPCEAMEVVRGESGLKFLPALDLDALLRPVNKDREEWGGEYPAILIAVPTEGDHATFNESHYKNIASNLKRPNFKSESIRYLAAYEQTIRQRFPEAAMIDRFASRFLFTSLINYDTKGRRNEGMRVQVIPESRARPLTDRWTVGFEYEMESKVTKRRIVFTFVNVVSSCLVVLQFTVALFKFIFPTAASVPFFFRYGSLARSYKDELPSQVTIELAGKSLSEEDQDFFYAAKSSIAPTTKALFTEADNSFALQV